MALSNPSAFVDNVIRFPLGLAGVSSPAASALPGHILVAALPGVHRIYVVIVVVLGGAALLSGGCGDDRPGTPPRWPACPGG